MNKEDLENIGLLLYGSEWIRPFSDDLLVSDRTMRRWAGGTLDIPKGLPKDIIVIMDARITQLENEIKYLT